MTNLISHTGKMVHMFTLPQSEGANRVCPFLIGGMIVIEMLRGEDAQMADRKSYIPFDFPAFMRDTVDLTDKQRILYQEMIWYQFDNEIPFESGEQICKLLGKSMANTKHFSLLLHRFFTEKVEVYCQKTNNKVSMFWQKRILLEIEKRRSKLNKDKENGHKGGRPKTKPLGFQSENQGKVSLGKVSLGNEDTNVSSSAGARETSATDLNFNDLQVEHGEAISEFWKTYPNGQNKHNGTKAFLRMICAGVDAETIIKGAVCLSEWVKAETKSRGKPPLIKHAQNWLETRGWEDELVMPEPQGAKGVNDAWAGFVDIGSSNIADYLN